MDHPKEEVQVKEQIPFEEFDNTKGNDYIIDEEDNIPMENLEDFSRDIEFEKITVADVINHLYFIVKIFLAWQKK